MNFRNLINFKNFTTITFLIIVFVAAILRLWQLGSIPPSPDWDEAALGYDAYSIATTGRDEFGKFLPPVLRSFDDYKPALYAYLAIPTVMTIGLNTFAVRLPSAIAGIIAVVAVYFIVQELLADPRDDSKRNEQKIKYIGLAASGLLAISPWSIQFSRVAFESNVGVLFNMLVVLFFLKGLKTNWLLYLSIIFAGLNIYVYQSEKVYTPLLFFILVIIYFKQLIKIPKIKLIGPVILGLIVVFPMVFNIFTDSGSLLRLRGTSIFTYQTEVLGNSAQKFERDKNNHDLIGEVLDNRRLVYAKTIVDGYLSHFNPNWLFITGDISRHHAPNMGLLYLFELPLILSGIYVLIFSKYDKKTKIFIFLWYLIAAVPASITTGVPHAVRTLNFIPLYQIFGAIGFISLLMWANENKSKLVGIKIGKVLILLYILFAIFNVAYYLNQYFVQLNYYDSADWQYGYKQAVDEVNSVGSNYNKIIVSDKQPLDKSYMFFLFYTKYPAAQYQKEGGAGSGSFDSHHSFGKFQFRPINWDTDSKLQKTLFIGTPDEIPNNASVIKTIYNLNGTPAIKIAGT
ncbi:MAG TPA: glycosyltransferase family 39 protein [Patescibacteria group bacterium]|nr:glycosyltransferase family 39 protein [Patescibacteria group bacterium]